MKEFFPFYTICYLLLFRRIARPSPAPADGGKSGATGGGGADRGWRLVAGRPQKITCRTEGSRPPAHITWHLDGARIEGGETVS